MRVVLLVVVAAHSAMCEQPAKLTAGSLALNEQKARANSLAVNQQKAKHNWSLSSISPETRQQLTVATVGLALFNDVLLLLMLVPMLPALLDEPGEMRLAMLFTAKDVCQVLCAPLAGMATLRFGAQTSLAVSLLGLAASTIAFAEAHGFPQLLAARALQGATSAALMSGGLTLIAQTHEPSKRGTAIARAHSGLGLGAAAGPVLGGLLYDSIGRRATFYAAASLVLCTAAAQLLLTATAPATFQNRQQQQEQQERQDESPAFKQLVALVKTQGFKPWGRFAPVL